MEPISLLVGGVLLAVGYVAGRLGRRRPAASPAGDAAVRLRPRAEPARPRDLHLLRRTAPRHLRPARSLVRAQLGAVHLPAVRRPAAHRRGLRPAAAAAVDRLTASARIGACPRTTRTAPPPRRARDRTPRPTSPRRRALLAATEPARTLATAGSMAALLPLLRWAPRGEPHPVLVLPGPAGVGPLHPRAARLARAGWATRSSGWALGRNRGPTQEVVDELPRLLDRLAGEHRTSVSVVGWSLGGIYARRLAQRVPGQVRQVISLGLTRSGSPDGGPTTAPGARVYRQLAPVSAAERRHTRPAARWPGRCPCRARRSTPAGTASSTGGPAASSPARGVRTWPCAAATSGWVTTPPSSGWWPTGWPSRGTTGRPFERPTRFGLGALFPPED